MFALPLWPWYLTGILFLALTNLIALEIPSLVKTIVDGFEDISHLESLKSVALLIIGFGIAQVLVRSLSRIFMFWPGRQIEALAKFELFSKVLSQPVQFFQKQETGDLVSRISNDIGHLRVLFAFGMLQIANIVFIATFTVYRMYSVDAWLATYCLLGYRLDYGGKRVSRCDIGIT